MMLLKFAKRFLNSLLLTYLGPQPKVLSLTDSIRHLLSTKKSVSRFGDGELLCALGRSIPYQQADLVLKRRLQEVLGSNNPAVELAIPDIFSPEKLMQRTEGSRRFWKGHLREHRLDWYRLISWKRTYLDSSISRFYFPFADKEASLARVELLKELWFDLDIVVVEGDKSRLGVGNDLFANAKSVSRIICPAENAFSQYEEILGVTKELSRSAVILAALGPTASVLVYDLAVEGYRAIDIGHVDIEYEWMLIGSESKQKIAGKYVGEAANGRVVDEVLGADDPYWGQIIARIRPESE